MHFSFAKHCALEIKVTGHLNATLKRYSDVVLKKSKLKTSIYNLETYKLTCKITLKHLNNIHVCTTAQGHKPFGQGHMKYMYRVNVRLFALLRT